jgi:hypothetical protein
LGSEEVELNNHVEMLQAIGRDSMPDSIEEIPNEENSRFEQL